MGVESMKPEPLKRSFMGEIIHSDFIKPDKDTYYLKQDIKSAVEWLKGEIDKFWKPWNKEYMETGNLYHSWDERIKEKVDKAFEDVIKK